MENKTKEQLLDNYIKNKHTQEECAGWIEGYDARQPEIDKWRDIAYVNGTKNDLLADKNNALTTDNDKRMEKIIAITWGILFIAIFLLVICSLFTGSVFIFKLIISDFLLLILLFFYINVTPKQTKP